MNPLIPKVIEIFTAGLTYAVLGLIGGKSFEDSIADGIERIKEKQAQEKFPNFTVK